MARLRGKPAGGQVTPPRKPKKSRAGPSKPDNSREDTSVNGFNDDPMVYGSDGTSPKPMHSTPNVTMSQTTAGTSRQLTTPLTANVLHRTISGTPSAGDWEEDQDSSFSETADRILSPRANRIDELRSIYHKIRDQHEKATKEVHSHLSSTPMTHEENMTLQQYLLHCQLVMAKAKLNLDIAISYATNQYGRSNTTDIPRLAITKGWLEESIKRVDTDTPTPETDYGSLFSELSHYFLATIITQHQHSMFGQRALPTVHEIAEIFQRTEPRSYVPGVGPFLELATGLATDDPLLMPEILRRLEVKMITDTSLKDRDDLGINTTSSQLRRQSGEPENTRNPFSALNEDGTVPEIDPDLDGAHVRYSSAELEIDPMLDAPSPASVSVGETDSRSRQPTCEMEIDPDLDSPLSIRYPSSSQMEIDSVLLAPSSANNLPAVYQNHRYENIVDEDVDSMQDQTPTENGLAENSFSTCEPKSEDEEEDARPDIVVGEQIEGIGIAGQAEKRELGSPELAEVPTQQIPTQQVKLGVDMDHHDGIDHTAEPRPFYMIREESTGLGEDARRDLSVVSDFSTFDEVMQDVQEIQENPDAQPIPTTTTIPTSSQTASDTESRANAPAVLPPAPSRFNIPDSFVISEDELEPDSNPYLAAYRAKQLASASASASNTPATNATVVCLPDVARRAGPRKSEPVILISSPIRPCATQPQAEQPVPQRQSGRISDSMFISDDSDDDIPPTSNPHLAALIRAKALASSSAPTSGSSTPTSSASTSKSARPKLPPHLARVRRAAHRQSLDPSSQVPTPEEKQLLDQEEYPLIDIIDEKTVDGEKKYLIKWKPIHGRRFLDTWEPAENANAASVEDWELQKARKGKRKEMERGKVKKTRRGTGRERRERPVKRSVAAITTQTTQTTLRSPTQHQSAPSSSLVDNPIFFVDTAGDASLASRGTRFVPTFHTPSSSPLSSVSTDVVSSRTRSRANFRDEPLAAPIEPVTNLTPEPASGLSFRYAARPFSFDSVSPAPQPIPASSSKPNNSDKYKTPAQQKARMREKRKIRRAEKADKLARRAAEEAQRLANMTEEQRAEFEHRKEMLKKSRQDGKSKAERKAEKLAAMSKEERQALERWLRWKKTVRARTKEIKKERKAKKAKRKEKEARRKARKEAQSAAEES